MPFGSTVLYLEVIFCFGHLSLASRLLHPCGAYLPVCRVSERSLCSRMVAVWNLSGLVPNDCAIGLEMR